MVTIKDIAAKVGVSYAAVSHALQGRPNISLTRRQEILEIAKQMGYRPHRSARFFTKGKTGTIAVLFPQWILSDWQWRQDIPLSLEVVAGIQDEMDKHNYEAALMLLSLEQAYELVRKKILDEQRVDGVVLFAENKFLRVLPEIVAQKIPAVSFWEESPGFGIPSVLLEVRPGIERMVEMAHQLGHRTAGCIYGAALDRRDLFISKCRSLGIEVLDKACQGVTDETETVLATQQIFRQRKRPTFLFYTYDHLAVSGIKTLASMGLRVPDDVSVAGMNDALYVPAETGPLSTVRMPFLKMGQLAARLLMDQIHGGPKSENIRLECPFVQRKSLGVAPEQRVFDSPRSGSRSTSSLP